MTQTPVADPVDLYDQDFLAWTQEQAARLRQAAASRLAPNTVRTELEDRSDLSAQDLLAIGAEPLDQAQVMGEWFPSVPPNQ